MAALVMLGGMLIWKLGGGPGQIGDVNNAAIAKAHDTAVNRIADDQ